MLRLKDQLKFYCLIPRTILNFIGAYPSKTGEYNFKKISISFLWLLYCLYNTLHTVVTSWPDFIEVAINISAVLPATLCICKLFNYVIYRKHFAKLIDSIEEEFWIKNETSSEEERNIVLSYGRFCYIFNFVQLVSILLAGPFWIFEPVLQMYEILPKSPNKLELILPFQTWVPFHLDKQSHPTFDVLYIMETTSILICGVILIACDTLFTFLVISVTGQFRLLQNRLEHFTRKESDVKLQKTYLYNCIKFHQYLCQFCDDLEFVTQKIILLQFFISAAFLCVSGLIISLYSGATYFSVRNGIFITAAMWQLFVHCFAADLLTTECSKVSEAAYNSDWFESSDSVKKLICLIIMRGQKQIHLTAWKFTPCSLESFEMVVRTAVSYFTVFNSVKDE